MSATNNTLKKPDDPKRRVLRRKDLLLSCNFGAIEGTCVPSQVGSCGTLSTVAAHMIEKSYDGSTALYFNNPAGQSGATEYVSFGRVPFAADDFTIRLWIKTVRGGCNGWSGAGKVVEPDTFTSVSALTDDQKTRGGVLLSNADFSVPGNIGFSIANMQQCIYLTTNFKTTDTTESAQISGVKDADDDRWHQLVVTFDRDGMECIFVDDKLIAQKDISAMAGQLIEAHNLVLGADGLGQFGLGEVAVGELHIYRGVMPESQVQTEYYLGEALSLTQELDGRNVSAGTQYTEEAVDAVLRLAEETKQKVIQLRGEAFVSLENAQKLYTTFREQYESFLLHTKKPNLKFMLLSDIHAEGIGCPRTETFAGALDWANELGMDAFMDGGDYSFFGKDHELAAYWDAVARGRKDMQAFVSVGNHETLELKSPELVRYQVGKLAKNGMLPENYNKFYYEGEVNGTHFLVLSQYSDTYTITGYKALWVHAGEIKSEQLAWLREKLEAYANQGKPVFLVIHNAIREVLAAETDNDYMERSVILSTEELYEILAQYPDAVVATGHVHHGFGACCGVFRTKAGYSVIDVPAFYCNQVGYGKPSYVGSGQSHTGYFIYVYDDVISLRAVDFVSRAWLTAYDQTIDIHGGK